MFTIKQISAHGEECHYYSPTVRFTPGQLGYESEDGRCGHGAVPKTVWIAGQTGEFPLTGGTVFVMNEVGKTISRYDLGPSPVPVIAGSNEDPRAKGSAA